MREDKDKKVEAIGVEAFAWRKIELSGSYKKGDEIEGFNFSFEELFEIIIQNPVTLVWALRPWMKEGLVKEGEDLSKIASHVKVEDIFVAFGQGQLEDIKRIVIHNWDGSFGAIESTVKLNEIEIWKGPIAFLVTLPIVTPRKIRGRSFRPPGFTMKKGERCVVMHKFRRETSLKGNLTLYTAMQFKLIFKRPGWEGLR